MLVCTHFYAYMLNPEVDMVSFSVTHSCLLRYVVFLKPESTKTSNSLWPVYLGILALPPECWHHSKPHSCLASMLELEFHITVLLLVWQALLPRLISVRSLILHLAVFVCEIGAHMSWVHGD